MSAETQITDQLLNDLMYIDTTNLYANNLLKAEEGYKPMSAENNNDIAFVIFGNRKPLKFTSDNKPYVWEGEVWIILQVQARTLSIARTVESWIEDFRKWLYQSSAVTVGKYYTLDTSLPSVVNWNGKELQQIQPNTDWENNISELTFKINIIYST